MKRIFTKLLTLQFFAVIFSPLPLVTPSPYMPTSNAGWYITDFADTIAIQSDGTVLVTEKIAVDFKNLSKHGIYRDFPYAYVTKEGKRQYTDVGVEAVTRDGSSEKYTTKHNSSNIRVQIGDADRTISGIHEYTIRYSVRGILSSYENYDELYWNVTGNEWEVPILHSSALVSLPKDGITQIACYEGYYGSADQCKAEKVSARQAGFTSSHAYYVGEDMTIAIGYQKGLVPRAQVSGLKAFWYQYSPWLVGVAPIILTVLVMFIIWYNHGRDRWKRRRYLDDPQAIEEDKPIGMDDVVVVEFDPPEKLRPAEIATIRDEKVETRDITATIVELASRGYLTITEEPKKGFLGHTDYILQKQAKDPAALLAYEQLILEKLFQLGDKIELSDLKNKFYKDLSKIKDVIYEDVTQKGYFVENPQKIRSKYALLAGIVLLLFGIGGEAIGFLPGIIIPSVLGLVVSAFVVVLFSRFMARRTAAGHELYRRIKGYELFLSKAEKYRQQFFERKNIFNEILPYAIALDLADKYANAFKALGVEPPQPVWYYGSQPFVASSFNETVGDFTKSLSTTIASAPGGSGSGGGGFSGGGGGGGGGGSW